MSSDLPLSQIERAFLATARRAILATTDPEGRPRLVPICFVLDPDDAVLWTPIDEKPKTTVDPLALARVRDIAARPEVSVLVDRWDEDWTRLGWLRIYGRASVVGPRAPRRSDVVPALVARYPQYAGHDLLARPLIRIDIERTTSWGDLSD